MDYITIRMNLLKATTIATALFISASLFTATITAYVPYVFAQTQQTPQDPQTQKAQPKPPKPPKDERDPTCPSGFQLQGGVCTAPAPACPEPTQPTAGGA